MALIKTKIKPVVKIFNRSIDGTDYELDIPQCQSVGNGDGEDDVLGCPCNHTTYCNAESVPRVFEMSDLYDLKTIGYPTWCPLADKETTDE